jgi:ABC-type molybdate transport system substrate-binding protein
MVRGSVTVRRAARSPVVQLSVLLVLAIVGWVGFDLVRDHLRASGCAATTVLTVAAVPEVAEVIGRLAGRVDPAARCFSVEVSQRESAAMADSPAGSDVWIPESTMWLRRAQERGVWNTPVAGVSVASSPVVLAVTDEVATGLPRRSWADVLGAGSVRIGFPDPTRDPVGLSTLLGLSAASAGAADPAGAVTAAMRRLSAGVVAQRTELEDDPAYPTSEQALLRHNAQHPGNQLVASYPPAASVPALDFPFVVLPRTQEAHRRAAESFLGTLLDQESAGAFAEAGFRTPDGRTSPDRTPGGRTSAEQLPPTPLPAAEEIVRVLNAWAAVNLNGRLQVLIDVSGSMAERVAGTNQTRMALTLQAAAQGLRLLRPTTSVGMWLFSTKLDGDRDYRVLLPVRTVSEQLAGGALSTLAAVRATPNGATGLYDSVLAAYQDSRRNWAPGRINTVVVLTDGRNEDSGGIGLDELLRRLRELQDPARPLTVIGIGIGPGIDPAELRAIATTTGGQAFTAADPTKIGEVFYAALSRMLCQPPACTAPGG